MDEGSQCDDHNLHNILANTRLLMKSRMQIPNHTIFNWELRRTGRDGQREAETKMCMNEL